MDKVAIIPFILPISIPHSHINFAAMTRAQSRPLAKDMNISLRVLYASIPSRVLY